MDKNKIEFAFANAMTNLMVSTNLLFKCHFYGRTVSNKIGGDKFCRPLARICDDLAHTRGGDSDVEMLRNHITVLKAVLANIDDRDNIHADDAVTFAIRPQVGILLDMAIKNIICAINEINTLA